MRFKGSKDANTFLTLRRKKNCLSKIKKSKKYTACIKESVFWSCTNPLKKEDNLMQYVLKSKFVVGVQVKDRKRRYEKVRERR